MRSNIEKWEYYLFILNNKTDAFVKSQIGRNIIPKKYYVILYNGTISERTILGNEVALYKHNGKTWFSGKKPTKEDVQALEEYAMSNITFSASSIYLAYSSIYNKETGATSTSTVKFHDVINQIGLFHSLSEAEAHAAKVDADHKETIAFKELHKKDASYNYLANGYKSLGWQNGWKHVYYDEDGLLCSETGKPHKSFGYPKSEYPEYRNCIDSGHKRIEVSHNQRGSENTVSCPICKIFWKYDCSD